MANSSSGAYLCWLPLHLTLLHTHVHASTWSKLSAAAGQLMHLAQTYILCIDDSRCQDCRNAKCKAAAALDAVHCVC